MEDLFFDILFRYQGKRKLGNGTALRDFVDRKELMRVFPFVVTSEMLEIIKSRFIARFLIFAGKFLAEFFRSALFCSGKIKGARTD